MVFVLQHHSVSRVPRVNTNQPEAERMDTDIVKGKLKQLGGEIKRKWGRMTDDDLMEAEGSLDKIVGRIQERTGEKREEIEKWFKSRGCE
jgi:uncharacterized protein YjbJ (UPF0337 family)